jgi:hypothetical protein
MATLDVFYAKTDVVWNLLLLYFALKFQDVSMTELGLISTPFSCVQK